jgi:hypothetical protein
MRLPVITQIYRNSVDEVLLWHEIALRPMFFDDMFELGVENALKTIHSECIKDKEVLCEASWYRDLPRWPDSLPELLDILRLQEVDDIDFICYDEWQLDGKGKEDWYCDMRSDYWDGYKTVFEYNFIRKFMILELKYVFVWKQLEKKLRLHPLFDVQLFGLIQSFLDKSDYVLPIDA